MATYKVIQDIEAEDKLLGPLTLKQFIFAGVAVICLYMCFLGFTKHFLVLPVIFLPPAMLAIFFAWPWSRDQPTEVWALAKIRFLFKPRKRIWDQSGTKELVTITAPKKVEEHFSNNLSPTEVKSRLRALADTIDSRGWAVKNVNVNLFSQPGSIVSEGGSDRLVNVDNLPQEVSGLDIQPSNDIFDERSNPTAQHFDAMITASSQAHRQQIVSQLQQQAAAPVSSSQSPATPPNDYWFMNQSAAGATPTPGFATFNTQVVAPGADDAVTAAPTAAEEALVERLHAEQQKPEAAYGHMRTIQPLSAQHAVPAVAPVTPATDPAILALATNNDLNVATIARQATPEPPDEQPDEVVISLH